MGRLVRARGLEAGNEERRHTERLGGLAHRFVAGGRRPRFSEKALRRAQPHVPVEHGHEVAHEQAVEERLAPRQARR